MTRLREDALREIAQFHEREVDCMPDLKPVKNGACKGPLEVDHVFGAGKRDAGYRLYREIVDRKRDLSYFRILCRFHNRQRTNDFGRLE